MADSGRDNGARGGGLMEGIGIGWRSQIAGFINDLPGLRFTEVVAESIGKTIPPALAELRARGVQIIPHGVKLSLGGAEPVSAQRVAHLAHCASLVDAPLVSEHIAFVRSGGMEAGHLLPLPRNWEAVHATVANVVRTQAELPVPIALEPVATLFEWPDDELTESQFITEILDRTGALLLLDVANVYANARNHGGDALSLLDELPLERIAYVHVAGGSNHDGRYHDTHTDAVGPEVLDLVTELSRRVGPPFLLERDGNYPDRAELLSELDALAKAAGLATIT